LPTVTLFKSAKTTKQVHALHIESGEEVKGYEIHVGETWVIGHAEPVFRLQGPGSLLGQVLLGGHEKIPVPERTGTHAQPGLALAGASIPSGQIWGTYLHGIFDNDGFRQWFLNQLWAKKFGTGFRDALPASPNRKEHPTRQRREGAYDQLADLIRAHIKQDLFYKILNATDVCEIEKQ